MTETTLHESQRGLDRAWALDEADASLRAVCDTFKGPQDPFESLLTAE